MPQPNDQLGPYILLEKLGAGQFGVVWKAQRHQGIAPPCAIKLPTDHEIKWADVEKEARVWLQATGHPNIVPMHEANIYDGQIALVSEYVAGGSLLDWLRKHEGSAPSPRKAVEIMQGVLAGLEHLHQRNIIHRDLKPANILLQGEIPRLADFGLARVLSGSQHSYWSGTLAYSPPESFSDVRSVQTDIWAAGVILYQLLTGRLPFPQQDPAALMGAISQKPPEPMPSDIPAPLQAIVWVALEKDCAQRYESATAMRQALFQANTQREGNSNISFVSSPKSELGPSPDSAYTVVRKSKAAATKLPNERQVKKEKQQITPITKDGRIYERWSKRSKKAKYAQPPKAVSTNTSKSENNKPGFIGRWIGRGLLGLFFCFVGVIPFVLVNFITGFINSWNSASFVEDLGNDVKLTMVKLPGGTFQRGADNGRDDEKPMHQVMVSPFAIEPVCS